MLYFIRHGETDFNQQGLWMGCTDIELNTNGQQQALTAATELANLPLDMIYTSPLQRAYSTAQAIASKQAHQPALIVLEELRERGFGVLEGTPRNQPLDDNFDEIAGVETTAALIARLTKALELVTPPDNQKVLIVSHGAVFHCLINHMHYQCIPKQDAQHIKNCSLVELTR